MISPAYQEARRASPRRHIVSWLSGTVWPVGFGAAVLVAWEGVARGFEIPSYLLPPPTAIVGSVINDPVWLAGHTALTMAEAVAGFGLANSAGFILAVIFAYSKTAEKAIYPYAIALKTTPIIAMAPLLVLWLGTGALSKIAASALICFFPILVNATRGLRSVEADALDLFHSLAAKRSAVFFKLRLPNSLPYVFNALKISTSLSVVGAIVGEFVGAQRGLGYVILISSYHLETEKMFAAVIAAALGGILFFLLVAWCERFLAPWVEQQSTAL